MWLGISQLSHKVPEGQIPLSKAFCVELGPPPLMNYSFIILKGLFCLFAFLIFQIIIIIIIISKSC